MNSEQFTGAAAQTATQFVIAQVCSSIIVKVFMIILYVRWRDQDITKDDFILLQIISRVKF